MNKFSTGVIFILTIIAIILGIIVYRYFTKIIPDIGDFDYSLYQEQAEHINMLENLASSLEEEIKKSPTTTTITVTRWKTKTVTTELPPSCIECFKEIKGLDYQTKNEYFVVKDFIELKENKLGSKGSTFEPTSKFKELVVKEGLISIKEEDNRLWRNRYILSVDAGVKDNEDSPMSAMSIGGGIEFINFKKCVGFELGGYGQVMITPQYIADSHISVGLDWRVVRNLSVGIGYGRSVNNNMILANVGVFLFD